jgi:hypothetical protein
MTAQSATPTRGYHPAAGESRGWAMVAARGGKNVGAGCCSIQFARFIQNGDCKKYHGFDETNILCKNAGIVLSNCQPHFA